MPAAIIPFLIAGGGGAALIKAGGELSASALNASAAKDAAKTQADAATKAAQLQSDTAAKQLAYEQQQAALQQANDEVNRRANYNQWLASEQNKNSLASMLGIPGVNIPAYVPGVQSVNGTLQTATAGAPSANVGGDPVSAAVAANYKALGVNPTGPGTGPTDIAYMVQKINETGGLTDANKAYWFGPNGRIAQELQKGPGGGGAPTAQAPTYASATLGSMGMPTAPATVAPSPVYQRVDPRVSGTIGGLAYTG